MKPAKVVFYEWPVPREVSGYRGWHNRASALINAAVRPVPDEDPQLYYKNPPQRGHTGWWIVLPNDEPEINEWGEYAP